MLGALRHPLKSTLTLTSRKYVNIVWMDTESNPIQPKKTMYPVLKLSTIHSITGDTLLTTKKMHEYKRARVESGPQYFKAKPIAPA